MDRRLLCVTCFDDAPVVGNWDRKNMGPSRSTSWLERAGVRGERQLPHVVVVLRGSTHPRLSDFFTEMSTGA